MRFFLAFAIVVLFPVASSAVVIVALPTSLPPIPPEESISGMDRDSHCGSVEEELAKPAPVEAPHESVAWRKGNDGKLIRLPGPSVRWPHQGCLMCLGIHLERTHRIPQGKLSALGHAQWDVLHSNLHNEAAAKVVEKKSAPPEPSKTAPKKAGGCSGGACSSPAAIRWRGLFR